MKRILLIPHIEIQNANALSSPYTIGFPAITAWLGAVHALQRKLNQNGFVELVFKSAGIISHKFNLQTYKDKGDFVYSIVGTGNPLDKEGARPAFIEEARCHLTVSLVVEYNGVEYEERDSFQKEVSSQLNTMKLAGGDILKFAEPELLVVSDEKEQQKLTRKLMPGFAIVERRDLMTKAMQEDQDAMTAMLDYVKVTQRVKQVEGYQLFLTAAFNPKQDQAVTGNAVILTNDNTAYFIKNGNISVNKDEPHFANEINRRNIAMAQSEELTQVEEPQRIVGDIVTEALVKGGHAKVQWEEKGKRKSSGWIVPIASGYHGITPLAVAKNQRDPNTPHRFAESIVTLGEFIMPYRIKDLDSMLWHSHFDIENNLYLCQQN